VGFVVDRVALGQVFCKYFGFPCHFSFHQLLHTHHLSSGGGTIGQILADVPSGLSLTPPQEAKKEKLKQVFTELIVMFTLLAKIFSRRAQPHVVSYLVNVAILREGREYEVIVIFNFVNLFQIRVFSLTICFQKLAALILHRYPEPPNKIFYIPLFWKRK
jgi:hypothetical protein